MYITINNVKGEKKIDLSYSIQNFDSDKEIAVIRMLSDNVQYQILKVRSVMDPISDTKKMVPNGTYASRELISILEGIIELSQFEIDDQVTKTNKLKGITEITLNLDELNNSVNLKDGRFSNSLLTYYMTDDKDFTRFEPQYPQYKKLKDGEFTALTLRITDQNNNVRTRQKVIVTHNPSEIDQAQELLVRFPNLGSDDVIIPGTANLSFNIELSSTVESSLKGMK